MIWIAVIFAYVLILAQQIEIRNQQTQIDRFNGLVESERALRGRHRKEVKSTLHNYRARLRSLEGLRNDARKR